MNAWLRLQDIYVAGCNACNFNENSVQRQIILSPGNLRYFLIQQK